MSVKRLLDCTPSELARYTKAELLDAIAGSEGRVLACETIGLTPPLLVDVTNAEYAASLSADILLLNMFDVQHPVINALPKVPEVETVRELSTAEGSRSRDRAGTQAPNRARRGHQSGALRPAGRQKQRWNALENERRTLGHRRKCTQGRRNGR